MPLNKFGLQLNHQRRQKGFLPEFRIRQMIESIINAKNFLVVNQSNEYDVDMKKIVNLSDPKSENDGVNKRYVDKTIAKQQQQQSQDGNLNMNGKRIINLSLPVGDSDGANKEYVDKNLAECVKRAGDGSLNMNGRRIFNLSLPSGDSDGVNKLYVDRNLAECVKRNRDGTVNLNDKRIVNLSLPLQDSDAVNKVYFDKSLADCIKQSKDGTINLNGSRILNMHLPFDDSDGANKQYVDKKLDGYFKRNEDGTLNLDEKRILNVAYPSASTDAANKQYVEERMRLVPSSFVVTIALEMDSNPLTLLPVLGTKITYFCMPWNKKEYSIPFQADIRILKTTFENEIEILYYYSRDADNSTVFKLGYSFLRVQEGGRLRFSARLGGPRQGVVDILFRAVI